MKHRRLRALIRKEFLQILRDPSAIAIAFVMPAFLLFLFGYGVSLDARHVPVAVVVEQPDRDTEAFVAGLAQSPYFEPQRFTNMTAASAALQQQQVEGILWLRQDFSRHLLRGETAPFSIIVNGVDANSARLLEGYLQGVWQNWLQQRARSSGVPFVVPAVSTERIWFNPALRSRNYLVPGLIAVIMTLIGALLTAMVVAREWERGTMEALMATPVTLTEILLGKLLPYFLMGMGGMALTVALALTLFAVPLVGSLWALSVSSALFLLVALGMGLLISTLARNQFVAGQLAVIVTFLPAFMLSGFIFDIGSMPAPVQLVTHVVAARYFVSILQTVFLAGDLWPVLLVNSAALAFMATIFLGLTWRLSRKRLD
ncbi:MAG: ABC transporter permease [Betaproteobacteria bacterium]|nr:ABC transporter permease [Betaproteobacteria bacterium]MDE2131511.1 ABC transporter permease [Betaproteobacteria bacterium]MDE2211136.1 ABC transporter permease [Betaproteobacteria bacterium]MDE2354489.1 ABC transporter permease [Betaproteobacteria bacterium]